MGLRRAATRERQETDSDLSVIFEPGNRRRLTRWIVAGVSGSLLLAGGGFYLVDRLSDHAEIAARAKAACGDVNSGVTKQGGECIGVTDGSYIFDPAYLEIEQKIRAENRRIESSPAVTVAVLDPITPQPGSALDTHEIRDQLEGAYTGQVRYNSSLNSKDETRIRLVLANEGGHETHWRSAITQLISDESPAAPLVAVIGLGVSVSETQEGIKLLSENGIASVGVITTADDLKWDATPGFVRVIPSNLDHVRSLKAYLDSRPDLNSGIMIYDSAADLFTGSIRHDLDIELGDWTTFPSQSFVGSNNPGGARVNMFTNITANLCAVKPKAVLFAGRQNDLDAFLKSLENRVCSNPITVLVGGTDLGTFQQFHQILKAKHIGLIYAAGTDVNGWRENGPGTPPHFQDFLDAYQAQGFPVDHLTDGEAMSGHDAMMTAAGAIRLAAQSGQPNQHDVLGQLLNLNGPLYYVQGATGDLSFMLNGPGGTGNPSGKPVPIMRIQPYGKYAKQVGTVFVTP